MTNNLQGEPVTAKLRIYTQPLQQVEPHIVKLDHLPRVWKPKKMKTNLTNLVA